MKKENKVISLDLAKKISKVVKEKGIESPESEWAWAEVNIGDKKFKYQIVKNDFQADNEFFPAYDTAELGEVLPRNIKIECGICTCKEWRVILFEKNLDEKSKDFMKEKTIKITNGLTESEAKGKMYLYLLENNLTNKIR